MGQSEPVPTRSDTYGVHHRALLNALQSLKLPDGVAQVKANRFLVRTPRRPNAGVHVYHNLGRWKCEQDSGRTDLNPCGHILAVLFHIGAVPKLGLERPEEPPSVRDAALENRAAELVPQMVPELMRQLAEVLDSDTEPALSGRGRPPKPQSQKLYQALHRVWERRSLREVAGRLMAEGQASVTADEVVKRTALSDFLNDSATRDKLERLLLISAGPAAHYESTVHVDGTAFTDNHFHSYFEEKHHSREERRIHDWILSIILHVHRTGVVPAVAFSKGECPHFVPLIERARSLFEINEAGADKAYDAWYNYSYGEKNDIDILVPIRGRAPNFRSHGARRRAHTAQLLDSASWKRKYHQRSSIESANHAIKAHLGDVVYSRHYEAQLNEILCMLIVYNLRRLVRLKCQHPDLVIDFKLLKSVVDKHWIPMHILQEMYHKSPTPRFVWVPKGSATAAVQGADGLGGPPETDAAPA